MFYGVTSWVYTNVLSIGNRTNVTVDGLVEGTTYYFAVKAVDTAGIESFFSNETSYKVPFSPSLTLKTNGDGFILPDLQGRKLVPGRSYVVSAIARAGQLFVGWSGTLTSSAPTLRFILKPNTALQANFVPNPYLPVQGSYSGLFCEAEAVRPESAGAVSVAITPRGSYSGGVSLGGKRLGFSGMLDLQCRATNVLWLSPSNSMCLQLRVGGSGGPGQLSGLLTCPAWVAPVFGDRLATATPSVGTYTLVVPGQDLDASLPVGDGFGTMRVSSRGAVTLLGRLADGTAVSQMAPTSVHALWPVYLPLYSGRGCALGWLAFTNGLEDDINGLLTWVKPAMAAAPYYAAGFTHQAAVTGSAYHRPGTSNRVLELTNAFVSFSGGNLASDFTNLVAVGPNGRVSNLSSNTLRLAFSPSAGTFSGSVTEPATGHAFPFSGVVLQKLNAGYGFLLGTNQSSRVSLAP
jgi:hypothetical protein